MTPQEQLESHRLNLILEAIDNTFDGLPLLELWQVMQKGLSFPAYITAVNGLADLGLIRIDSNHVAHRVKS